MIQYEDAQNIIRSAAAVLPAVEVPLKDALGHVLARDIYSLINQPPFHRSALDGYAFRFEDAKNAAKERPAVLRVTKKIPAGHVCGESLPPGEAARIFTGAMLPGGADSVIGQEYVVCSGDNIIITQDCAMGQNVAQTGEDLRKGEILMRAGKKIGPADLGLLSSQGITGVGVCRKPIVAIISSGSEVLELGTDLEPGKIYNSNRYTLAGLVERAGGIALYGGKIDDSFGAITASLRHVILQADIVLTTGGVSVGEYDLIPAAVQSIGAKLLFHRVAIRPGTPVLAAQTGQKLLFGLSGNPGACLVGFLQFVLPAIKIMQGITDWQHRWIQATLGDAVPGAGKVSRFIAASTVWQDGCFIVNPAEKQKPGSLSSFSQSNSFIMIAAGQEGMAAGSRVPVQIFPEVLDASPLFA